jgi:hypothetical protein
MTHLFKRHIGLWLAAAVLLGLTASQSAAKTFDVASAYVSPRQDTSQSGKLDESVCNPDAGPFSLDITNPYLPYQVGRVFVLKGVEDGVEVRVRVSVLDRTEKVAGVTTRVVEERAWEDGELHELALNYFAQAPDGTVCYFGEEVNYYENGKVVSHEGAWRAGENGNLPGIAMPAHPEVGMRYAQERAPGVSEDQAEIVAMGRRVTVPAGSYPNTLRIRETSPLDPGAVGIKFFAPGVGLVKDDTLQLIAIKSAGDADDD